MGRRAKKAPVVTKKRPTLAKNFKCPFCANEGVVECKMDFKRGVGSLTCRLCGASYQMPIHHLHEPVDVFSEWLDDCEAAARQQQQSGGGGSGGAVPRYQEDDGDDDLPEASGLGRAKAPAKSTPSAKDASKGGSQKATYDDLGGGDSEDDDED